MSGPSPTSLQRAEDAAVTLEGAGPPTVPVAEVDDRTPHLMRIAAQGKLRTYVAFALKFLQESHNRPLVLHTLPLSSKPASGPPPDAQLPTIEQPVPPSHTTSSQHPLAPCTTCIPRLIAVAEIIKREFVELMATSPQPERRGWTLKQYNELGCLEDLSTQTGSEEGRVTANEDRGGEQGQTGLSLLELLEGKHHLQIKRTPYMKITLTKVPLPSDAVGKATYQEPLPSKKRSKSARARERKKQKRAAAAPETNNDP
ncbi:hypothetical protein DACRYDRAFT_106246 [Dacryopinax primogenitus]|uniref:Uncharacterized protein n=1 Tax=Dacryopinax primogenitus (strain DJM 731) TaxID=1858805 RepID=M5G2Z2_DACPD|nr:uncharacterized protein DACRYDRAFT_106246 [Dacryopinax primogenitus]EJU03069.1 hypothetical protein DACRYDRAFT_106246 [Dacryopinax primogenitus]